MEALYESALAAATLAAGNSQKARKEGTSQLLSLLGNDEFLRALDLRRPQPGESIDFVPDDQESRAWCSWPGLVKLLLTRLQTDILIPLQSDPQPGKAQGKRVDASLTKCFRLLITNGTRPQRAAELARVARSLFTHVATTLRVCGQEGDVADTYVRVLHALLQAPHLPSLCLASSAATCFDILANGARQLLGAGGDAARRHVPAITRQLQRLEVLLQRAGASTGPPFAHRAVRFFTTVMPLLAGWQEDAVVLATSAVSCVMYFMAMHGPDAYSSMPRVYAASAALIRLLWTWAVDHADAQASPGARVTCASAALVALRLDAVQAVSELKVIRSLALREAELLPSAPHCTGAAVLVPRGQHLHRTRPLLTGMQALTAHVLAAAAVRIHERCTSSGWPRGNRQNDRAPNAAASAEPTIPAPRTFQNNLTGSLEDPPRQRRRRSGANEDVVPITEAGSGGCGGEPPAQRRRLSSFTGTLGALEGSRGLQGSGGAGAGMEPSQPDTLHGCLLGGVAAERARGRSATVAAASAAAAADVTWRLWDAGHVPEAPALARHLCGLVWRWGCAGGLLAADGGLEVVAWSLLALEGIARGAWGVPAHQRHGAGVPAADLLPREVAAAVDWAGVLRAGQSVLALVAGAPDGSTFGAVPARALLLLEALLQHCLVEPTSVEARTWEAVAKTLEGKLAPVTGQPSGAAACQAVKGAAVRLDTAYQQSQAALAAPQTPLNADVELDTVRAAAALHAERLWNLHQLHMSPPGLLSHFARTVVAAPLQTDVACCELLRGLGLSRPKCMRSMRLGNIRAVDVGGSATSAFSAGDMDDAGEVHGGTPGREIWNRALDCWACSSETASVACSAVPPWVSPAARARRSLWLRHQQLSQPHTLPPVLCTLLSEQSAELSEIAGDLTATIDQACVAAQAESQTGQENVHTLLRVSTAAAAVALGLTEAAEWHWGPDAATWPAPMQRFVAGSELLDAVERCTRALVATDSAPLIQALRALGTPPPDLPASSGSLATHRGTTQPETTPLRTPAAAASIPATGTHWHASGGHFARGRTQASLRVGSESGFGGAVRDAALSCGRDAEVVQDVSLLSALLAELERRGALCVSAEWKDVPGVLLQHVEGTCKAFHAQARQELDAQAGGDDEDALWGSVPATTDSTPRAGTLLLALSGLAGVAPLLPGHARRALCAAADAFSGASGPEAGAFGPGSDDAAAVPWEWTAALTRASLDVALQPSASAEDWEVLDDVVQGCGGLQSWMVARLEACHLAAEVAVRAAEFAAKPGAGPRAAAAGQPPSQTSQASSARCPAELAVDLVEALFKRCELLGKGDQGQEGPRNELEDLVNGSTWQLRTATLHALQVLVRVQLVTAESHPELCERALMGVLDPSVRVRLAAAGSACAVLRHAHVPLDACSWLANYLSLPGLARTLAAACGPHNSPSHALLALLNRCRNSEPSRDGSSRKMLPDVEARACAACALASASAELEQDVTPVLMIFSAAVVLREGERDARVAGLDTFAVTARVALDCAAARRGYASWPHQLLVSATPLLAQWVASGGNATDLGLIGTLMALPRQLTPWDPHGPPGSHSHKPTTAGILLHTPVQGLEDVNRRVRADERGPIEADVTRCVSDCRLLSPTGLYLAARDGGVGLAQDLGMRWLQAGANQAAVSGQAAESELQRCCDEARQVLLPFLAVLVPICALHSVCSPAPAGTQLQETDTHEQMVALAALFGLDASDLVTMSVPLALACGAVGCLGGEAVSRQGAALLRYLHQYQETPPVIEHCPVQLLAHTCLLAHGPLRPLHHIQDAAGLPAGSDVSSLLSSLQAGWTWSELSRAVKELFSMGTPPATLDHVQLLHVALIVENYTSQLHDARHLLWGVHALQILHDQPHPKPAGASGGKRGPKAAHRARSQAGGTSGSNQSVVVMAVKLRILMAMVGRACDQCCQATDSCFLDVLREAAGFLQLLLKDCSTPAHISLVLNACISLKDGLEVLLGCMSAVRDAPGPLEHQQDWVRSALCCVDGCVRCATGRIQELLELCASDDPRRDVAWQTTLLYELPRGGGVLSAYPDMLSRCNNQRASEMMHACVQDIMEAGCAVLSSTAATLTRQEQHALASRLLSVLADARCAQGDDTQHEVLSGQGVLNCMARLRTLPRGTVGPLVSDLLAVMLELSGTVEDAMAAESVQMDRLPTSPAVGVLMHSVLEDFDRRSQTSTAPQLQEWLQVTCAATITHLLGYLVCRDQASVQLSHSAAATALHASQMDDFLLGIQTHQSLLGDSSLPLLPHTTVLLGFHDLAQNCPRDSQHHAGQHSAVAPPTSSQSSWDPGHPQSAGQLAMSLVATLRSQPSLRTTAAPFAHIASISPALAQLLLPVLLLTAACDPESEDVDHALLSPQELHWRQLLADVISKKLLPQTHVAAQLLACCAEEAGTEGFQGMHGPQAAGTSEAANAITEHGGTAESAEACGARRAGIHVYLLQVLGLLRSAHRAACVWMGNKALAAGPGGEVAKKLNHVANWETSVWLELDYMQLALVCCMCTRHQEALMYLEAWSSSKTRSARLDVSAQQVQGSAAQLLANTDELEPAEAVLLRAASSLPSNDLFHGATMMPKEPVMLRMAEEAREWPQALLLHVQRMHATNHFLMSNNAARALESLGHQPRLAIQGATLMLARMGCGDVFEGLKPTFTGSGTRSASQCTQAPEPLESAHEMSFWENHWACTLPRESSAFSPSTAPLGSTLTALSTGQYAPARGACKQARVEVACAALNHSFSGPVLSVTAAWLRMLSTLQSSIQLLQRPDAMSVTTGAHGLSSIAKQELASLWSTVLSGTHVHAPAALPLVTGVHAALLCTSASHGATAASAASTAAAAHADALRKVDCLSPALRVILGTRRQQGMTRQPADFTVEDSGGLGSLGGSGAAAGACWGVQEASPWWRVSEAKVLWGLGHRGLAMQLLGQLLQQHDRASADGESNLQCAAAWCLRAKWKSEMHSDTTAVVMKEFQTAVDLLKRVPRQVANTSKVPGRLHFRLARFADQQHSALRQQLASQEHSDRVALMQYSQSRAQTLRDDLAGLKRQAGSQGLRNKPELLARAKTISITASRMQKDFELLQEEMRQMTTNAQTWLMTALKGYHGAMQHSTRYDLTCLLRLISLWLESSSLTEVNEAVGFAFQELPSYKLLGLAYQVASRLGSGASGLRTPFQAKLRMLLTRLGCEHPHHVLITLLALESQTGTAECDSKRQAATEVLQAISSTSSHLRSLVADTRKVVGAYTDIALASPTDAMVQKGRVPISQLAPRAAERLSGVHRVPVLSVVLPARADAVYDDLGYVSKVHHEVRFVGGVNAPKLMVVLDSLQQTHKQLVKKNDDLRQDAVMQQFFTLVNSLLEADPRASRRGLRIRTYKAVAFSPAAGLLQWVDDTVSLYDYLVGNDARPGAHARYRHEGDLLHRQIQQKIAGLRTGTRAEKSNAYAESCARFPPVLRYFFLERYHSAPLWHQKQTAYARSVAVNSMAGYIIGLGDRHTNNILLACRTAEMVHIDLGIAFECGRHLPTPETTPFRLTRDVVDGLGVTGVHGAFQFCSEVTMHVLRRARQAVITIVEVFVHDPLYQWGMTTRKAAGQHKAALAIEGMEEDVHGADDDEGIAVNADAERAVSRVNLKLRGLDWNEGEPLSVEGHTQQLIMQASDPELLSQHYVGWAPWL